MLRLAIREDIIHICNQMHVRAEAVQGAKQEQAEEYQSSYVVDLPGAGGAQTQTTCTNATTSTTTPSCTSATLP
jgi:hypothetical protein